MHKEDRPDRTAAGKNMVRALDRDEQRSGESGDDRSDDQLLTGGFYTRSRHTIHTSDSALIF